MATVGTELDRCQQVLQDASTIGNDGTFWTRQMLLDWFVEGYRQFLALTAATRRWTVLDVPPRVGWAISQPWEAAFCQDGTFMQWTHQTEGGWAASHLWEIELLEGITPTDTDGWTVTHPWERTLQNPTYQHFRFALPRDTERVIKLWFNNKFLVPIATRALDRTETSWWSVDGEPVAWTLGTGRNRTVEVYEIETTYSNNYIHKDAVTQEGNPRHGIARQFSGSLTYSWQSDSADTIPYGLVRRLESADRQYMPRLTEPLRHPLGRVLGLGGSSNALLVLEARVPDVSLTATDEAVLLPPQMGKYLRWYVLMRAFNQQGPGYNGLMAAFYEQRVARGMRFLRRMHQLARKDRRVQRAPVMPSRRRPPRVRLPTNYPAVFPR